MEALVIKEHLHKLVVDTDDMDVLLQVEAYFESLLGNQDWWDELSEKQKKQIEVSREQLAKGEAIPHEAVREKVKKIFARYE
jgi:hypothetical protein